MDIYQSIIRPILFSGLKADPEWLHQQTLALMGWLDRTHDRPLSQWLQVQMHQNYVLTDSRLQQSLWNLTFCNPIGLSAGFDKDGVASGVWPHFGFGFAELGTVTWQAQPGNPQPRLFRLPADHAALNRMGFNNHGANQMAEVLSQRWSDKSELSRSSPIGINLGKSKVTPLTEAASDYQQSFCRLKSLGDYFVVNVSSPNTPGLRSLQSSEQLAPILAALQSENTDGKPILIKIAPDLEFEAIAEVIALAQTHHLAGIIATNTTIRREGLKTQILEATGNSIQDEVGGISGAPVRSRSTEIIRFIYRETSGQLPIIGVGGIFSAADAWEKITAGASLVQVYTGWIYEGPWMVRRILAGLLERLEAHGLSSLSAAIGLEHRGSESKPN